MSETRLITRRSRVPISPLQPCRRDLLIAGRFVRTYSRIGGLVTFWPEESLPGSNSSTEIASSLPTRMGRFCITPRFGVQTR
jgi:hypothetical protein